MRILFLLRRCYFFRLLSSLSPSPSDLSGTSNSRKPCSSSSQAIRVAFWVLKFSTSGGAPAISCRARLAASTTYANWLSGAFVCTVISVLPSKRCQKFFHAVPPTQAATAQSRNNGLPLYSGSLHVLVHNTKVVVLAESRDLLARFRQPPPNLFVGILSATTQAPLQLRTGRRQDENSYRFRQLFLYLRRALDVDL